MSKLVNAKKIKNFPWQECPKDFEGPIWRYDQNPVIPRHPNKIASRVFNSALVPFKDEFIGVFRGDGNDDIPHLYVGRSKDGINFKIDSERIRFLDENGNEFPETSYQYDPRVIPLEDKYYIVWCDDFWGPTISLAVTEDFKTFTKYNYPFLPCNRNGVLFPRKINGKYYMLSRPSDLGHTPFGDIFVSESTDLKYWGNHKLVAKSGWEWWCALKIGPGPVPIELDDGWLLFTHGVNRTCNGYVYNIGVMLLDKNDPSKVLMRSKDYILSPEKDYEITGFVPNVLFPTCVLANEDGRLALYYGSADTYTCLAFTTVDRVMKFLKEHKR